MLLIERNPSVAAQTAELLRAGWEGPLVFTHAESLQDAQPALGGGSVGAILLGAARQLAGLEGIRVSCPAVPAVVIAPEYSAGDAALALRAGAQDYLSSVQLSGPSLARALVHAIERKHAESTLAQRALQDPLTGLPNRNLFIDRVGVALDRARRSGGVTAVLFLDVDGFKAINDSLGHGAGDEVLTVLGTRLRTALRPMDTVARFGGDEFTFLFEGLSSPGEAAAIADRVRAAASEPISVDGDLMHLRVSIGAATTSDPTVTPESLIRQADFAMYEAKRGGGDIVASPPGPPAPPAPDTTFAAPAGEPGEITASARPRERGGLPRRGPHDVELPAAADELEAALQDGEMRVVYQPLYGLDGSSELIGLEALVRWEHPERGTILAAEFVPTAERAGLMPAIGQFVLQQSLGLLRRLSAQGSSLTVSINLSPEQLGDVELAAALAAVEAADIVPALVCAEIPERAVSADPEQARRAAQVLHAAGIRVAIDDYGTGDVSLSSLRTLEADELKIHESFVRELGRSSHSGVVRAVVELGHALGMKVVAEGVETDSELGELRSLGCDLAQGYLLSHPLQAEQIEALVLAGS